MRVPSRFIDMVSVPPAVSQFERWLRRQRYCSVDETYPLAIPAVTLVDEFFNDYPELNKYRSRVTQHANAIGFISDYAVN